MTLYKLAIIAVVISAVFMQGVNAFADTGCRRDCEPPSLGVLYTGQRVVEKGFTINGKSFDVFEHTQTIPTTTVKTGDNIRIKLVVYENSGVNNIRDVSVSLGKYYDDNNINIMSTISFKQVFSAVFGRPLQGDSDVTQTSSVSDPNGMIKDVSVSATPVDSFRTVITISFKVVKPFDVSDIIISTTDAKRGSGTNVLYNAISAKGSPLVEKKAPEPKQVVAPLKQIKTKLDAKNIECREGLELVVRKNGQPACVYPFTAELLRELQQVK